jgi:hypothetical protein
MQFTGEQERAIEALGQHAFATARFQPANSS